MVTLRPMLPTLVESIPEGSDWVYEAKYDGFRALLYLYEDRIELISRNLKNISNAFPEITKDIRAKIDILKYHLPLVLDGEIVILESQYRASFEKIQIRGRSKNGSKILTLANDFPAHFIAFDLLMISGVPIMEKPLQKRKESLLDVFNEIELHCNGKPGYDSKLKNIQFFNSSEEIWRKIVFENGEGIVAKRINSTWVEGSRTLNWLKVKNWRNANFFILSFEKQNGYFHVGLLKGGAIFDAGLFLNGMSEEEILALQKIIKANAVKEDSQFIYIKPSICVELYFLDWYKDKIRQPRFSRFRLDLTWEACTWEEARKQSMNLL
ncbi:non-homologous end-joining DNA ligase [Schinkia sp. CFF1]